MAKEAYYFSHDYNARNDPKMVCLLMKTGVAGVGVYWCVIEMLYEQGGYLMQNECERIAFELRVDSSLVHSVITCDLFGNDGEKFWSESVMRRLKSRKEKSVKARDAAIIRWNNANALHQQSNGYAIKGKERKV